MLLTKDELKRIRAKTTFDEEEMRWVVPRFYLKAREVSLPTIGKS
jgi:hypothetical protein